MADAYLDLSVVLITLNEEKKLELCLNSLPKGCEIIVLDSGSTDQTEKIATKTGAIFQTRKFDDYSNQKNAAINLATRRWVFSVDADEILSPNLAVNIEKFINSEDDTKPRKLAYRVTRKLVFFGKPMNYGKTKDHPIRLFQRGTGKFMGEIHERLDFKDSDIGIISGQLDHFSYENLEDYFEKFNRYTGEIALKHYKSGKPAPSFLFHMLRPWFEFFSRYFLRLGFLDGKAGYTYAFISSLYTYIKYDKLRELYLRSAKK